jgi:hypothetical protein
MAVELADAQIAAVLKLENGNILCGGVGSGKSRTALAYYVKECGGDPGLTPGVFIPMPNPVDLYIITTAQKRDRKEWELEMLPFRIGTELYSSEVVVDSWNNIGKYSKVTGAFFIFDEQRVVGNGKWVEAFLKIAKSNRWILLSATPGDTWQDYIPVFLANGFYRTRTEFEKEHIIFSPWVRYKKVDRYLNTKRLVRLRDKILVDIDVTRRTVEHHETLYSGYDVGLYRHIMKDRWNPWENKPLKNASELCSALRRVANESYERQQLVLELCKVHPRVIIFYNFNYEREILLNLPYGDKEVAEWSGWAHQPIPEGTKWVYLVQYTAGAEGWNCTRTDTIIFYSQSYSYKATVQAAGRINRLNTMYIDLYYYHLTSRSSIDLAINRSLKNKKQFNETKFIGTFWKGVNNAAA